MIRQVPKKILVGLINLYQLTLSPDHSWLRGRFPYGYCRHYPSCSEYAKQAINEFGIFKGSLLSIKRIVRCNPFVEPSVDLPK